MSAVFRFWLIVISYFNQHYVKTGIFPEDLSKVIRFATENREKADYLESFDPETKTVVIFGKRNTDGKERITSVILSSLFATRFERATFRLGVCHGPKNRVFLSMLNQAKTVIKSAIMTC